MGECVSVGFGRVEPEPGMGQRLASWMQGSNPGISGISGI